MKPLIVTTALMLAAVITHGLAAGFNWVTATGSVLTAVGLGIALRRGAWRQ